MNLRIALDEGTWSNSLNRIAQGYKNAGLHEIATFVEYTHYQAVSNQSEIFVASIVHFLFVSRFREIIIQKQKTRSTNQKIALIKFKGKGQLAQTTHRETKRWIRTAICVSLASSKNGSGVGVMMNKPRGGVKLRLYSMTIVHALVAARRVWSVDDKNNEA